MDTQDRIIDGGTLQMKGPGYQKTDVRSIRFVGQKSTHIVHDKTYARVKEISEDDIVGLDELDKSMQICTRCQKKVYIRNAIKDDENFAWYVDFFDRANYGKSHMKGFIYLKRVELAKISNKALKLKYKDDTWIVIYEKRNRYYLFHNDYIATSVDDRCIIPGKYHYQMKDPMRLKDAFRYIALYDWEGHFE